MLTTGPWSVSVQTSGLRVQRPVDVRRRGDVWVESVYGLDPCEQQRASAELHKLHPQEEDRRSSEVVTETETDSALEDGAAQTG